MVAILSCTDRHHNLVQCCYARMLRIYLVTVLLNPLWNDSLPVYRLCYV